VGEAPNGRLGIDVSRSTYPDVVLMDVRMPEMDGLEAARRLLDPPPGVVHRPKVIVLTTFDCDDYVYEALQAGVSGFLLKDAPIAELVQAVRVIAAGTRCSPRPSPAASSRTSPGAAPPSVGPHACD
jgi:DNA-binding NarL/FixJ family response regulator